MKYLVVWYQDSLPMGNKKFNTLKEAEKKEKEIRELKLFEEVKIYEVEK